MLSLMSQRGNTSAMVKGFYYVSLDSNYFVYKVGVGYKICQLNFPITCLIERERERAKYFNSKSVLSRYLLINIFYH